MKCNDCGLTLVKQQNAYVCPGCGATIAEEAVAQSRRNRVTGAIIFIAGIAAGILLLIVSRTYVLTILGLEIPFGMVCAGVVCFLIALVGLFGALGKVDVTDMFSK